MEIFRVSSIADRARSKDREVRARPDGTEDLIVDGTRRLRPTPDILDALEKDYPIEASVADLVDNSIDAQAGNVLIRFARRGQRLVNLCIADDGFGMDEDTIDLAMQFAARRAYGPNDLGMFGVGMKTASLSQADMVTVVSRAKGGPVIGRQWTKAGIKEGDWSVNLIAPRSAEAVLDKKWGRLGVLKTGTLVRWDHVYDFDRLRQGVDEYIARAIARIKHHLGLTLHRFLERKGFSIQIDVEDLESGDVGPPSEVQAMNPFPPRHSNGERGFPKTFSAQLQGAGTLTFLAHIWRKKSGEDGYKLGGGRVAEHQGFYFYRHDRLIQDGGWNGLIGTNEPHLSLARVEVDIPDELHGYLKVRSNKAGVDVPATFPDSVLKATSEDGRGFKHFLARAEDAYRRRGELKARPMLQPGEGIPSEVKDALKRLSAPFHRGQAFSVTWRKITGNSFFEIDHGNREVRLNLKFRRILLRDARGGKTDVPLIRTLLYFALEGLLSGDRIGKVEGLRLEAIQSAMTAALKAERRWAEE